MTTTPPPTPAVRAALTRLGRDDLTTALHLALPVDVPTTMVRRTRDRLVWRDAVVPAGDDVATTAAVLAAAGHRDGDRYLDLHRSHDRLVKWIRSGSRWYAHGTDTLLGGPSVTAEATVSEGLRTTLAAMAADRRRPVPPFVVSGADGSCIIEGDDDAWHAVAGTGPGRPSGEALDLTTLAWSVVDRLGGSGLSFDDHRVVVRVDDQWTVTVPLVRFERSAIVGVPTTRPGDLPDPATVPSGFVAVGYDPDGRLVVAHIASGIRAVLHDGTTW